MIDMEDCIAFSGLSPDQLEAVALYHHIPEVVAAEWCETVLETPEGQMVIERIISLEVESCELHHNTVRAARFRAALQQLTDHV